MAVTIRTVADATGLSMSTVSRALANKGRINETTREYVAQKARELGYKPNSAARTLISGRSRNLGLVVPTITNPFFAALIKGAHRRSRELGYTLYISDANEDEVLEAELFAELAEGVEGFMIAATPSRDVEERVRSYAATKRTVLLNLRMDGVASATADTSEGLRQAVDHLAALGHRTIGFLAGSSTSWSSAERARIVAREAERVGLDFHEFGPYSPDFGGGAAATSPLLTSGATAVIAYNDMMALGLLSQMHALDVPAPGALSIVGIDDIPYSAMSTPRLSSVRVDPERIGKTAVELLVKTIEHETDGEPMTIPTAFVVRESTAAPRSA